MTLTIAIPVAGNMGAAIGERLVRRGARVVTNSAGRSPETVQRAREAGFLETDDRGLTSADMILSVVPPGVALDIAGRLAAVMPADPLVYADLNAVSPHTTRAIADLVAASGAAFVDGAIIGLPPRDEGDGPAIYLSGENAGRLLPLAQLGLDLRVLDGGIGAASALKMCYGGITKGLTAIAASMLLAAQREGIATALHAELAKSQPDLLGKFEKSLPRMYSKAYRWIDEMEEIAGFLGHSHPGGHVYEGIAEVYRMIAADQRSVRRLGSELDAFLAGDGR